MTQAGPSQTPPAERAVPPLLLPEALGFSPQLLLDDIINIANSALLDGVSGMESYLQKWAEERADRLGSEWDNTQEVEQGLVSFQTLLEHHTDLAFDFFEAWSLRNIFAVPPDLPLVLPHQEGLDLTLRPEREQELMDENAELRRRLSEQKQLKRMQIKALHAITNRQRRSAKRLERLSFLDTPALDVSAALPRKLMEMHSAVSNLPPIDPETIAALAQFQETDSGKRQWETSKSGYLNWAVSQLLSRSKTREGGGEVEGITEQAAEIGQAEQLRQAFEITNGVREDLENAMQMDTR
ncbi:Mis12 protein-domain-containing protein [Desarmillaria tabescens]|uniref:Mis12 protein-domain-containing protein n=1 Tax=Armillaria tabescens TaxID=1929756 RepID=A0AA39NGU8_ARMTA|nr:Mis12 protein-domain-containing protein [Desarmillaria tabescens]KAK0465218.1 Mis12 protein-domain-containing protein [Desarmillaria tabescens]